jgi:hypothetical protein
MDIPYVNERKHKESNIEKLKEMGKRKTKKAFITAFISTGNSKDMNKYQIAAAAKVETNDTEMMRHIEVMLKRRDERNKNGLGIN